MSQGGIVPDPSQINSVAELGHALTTLRRRAARKGQVQLSVRDLATRTGRAPSTLHPYLRGDRLCPADVFESLLRALGIDDRDVRPWLDAWDRIADNHRATSTKPGAQISAPTQPGTDAQAMRSPQPDLVAVDERLLYRLERARRRTIIGIVPGDLRRVRFVDVWVNSENTSMQMSRFEEYSVSAIVRFEGAVRDDTGRVVDDIVATELAAKVAGRAPVAPGTAVTTGAGELTRRNGVRYVIHVAAVHGEPGEGYRQIRDVGRCVVNALAEAERLAAVDRATRSILFPILGVGVAGGALEPTVRALLGAAIDHLSTRTRSQLSAVYLLASTPAELETCRAIFDTNPRLTRIKTPARRT